MHGALILAIVLGMAVFIPVLFRGSSPADRKWLLLCLVATVPMSWLMFHLVRIPVDHWLQKYLGNSNLLSWLRTAYAPLTEEPAKLWPLLILPVRQSITRENLGRFALALGLGFALGEMLTVAGILESKQPEVVSMPWYLLGGFISERLFTCATHPAMTSLTLAGWRRGGNLPLGLACSMYAHYLANFPITMAQRGWLGRNLSVSATILSLWVLACFLASLLWLARFYHPKARLGRRLFGEAICPGCGRRFDRGVFTGLNMGVGRRYERCPFCRQWHWTQLAPPKNAAAPEVV